MASPVPVNLALRDRRIDIFFAVVFSAFTVTSIISDLLPTVGVDFSHPFYPVLVFALVTGRNWIQLPSVIYATMIASLTGIVVFGVEFFGEPELRTQNPVKFLLFNLPYVLVPLILLVRMRKPLPFTRRF